MIRVGCEDCGFNEDGECGVCCSEEKAWKKYTDGIHKLENAKQMLDDLICKMKEWKGKVEELENDILDFETYGLKSLWQSFYSKRNKSAINYDYKINLIFKNIEFSPEIINEKEKNN